MNHLPNNLNKNSKMPIPAKDTRNNNYKSPCDIYKKKVKKTSDYFLGVVYDIKSYAEAGIAGLAGVSLR